MSIVLSTFEPKSADAHAMRVLPIVADLMPPEIIDARRAQRAQRAVLSALAAFAVLLCAWYGFAAYQTSVARDELAEATTESANIQREQQKYGDVTRLQAQSNAITADLTSLFGTDVRWSKLLAALRTEAPARVRVSSASATLVAGGGGAPAPAAAPVAGQPAAIGSVEISGSAPDKGAVADYLEALAAVPGLANPLLASATDEDNGVQFSMRVDITAAALGGRFNEPKGQAGK
ncbi:MAG TPA: PilN domain-containing protein [Catenuloplanes sp.]|jgi:Tfp pilus assembly protein PilN